MEQTLRLLFLEDSLLDVELCVKELERAGYHVDYRVVQDEDEFLDQVEIGAYDVVLADYNFPGFSGMDALRELRSRDPDKPFLIVSGSIGEETAVESIKAGANDYVLKDRLVRLPLAVQQALDSWKTRMREKRAEDALRETNEKLRALVQASPLAIVAVDPDGRVRMWNPAAERIFGWPRLEVIGHLPPFIQDNEMEEFRRSRERVLRGESFTIDAGRHKKDGTPMDITISLAPLRDAAGEISGVMAIIADVTERKRDEEAKREMERSLVEAKRQFYRETILAVTGGKLEIADPAEMCEALKGAPFTRSLDRSTELSRTRQQTQDYCAECGLEGDRLTDFVMGVGEAMTNALKHAQRGKVYARCGEDNVWVAVADRGPGIDALVLPGATLRRGFSTKPSLGLGYSVILQVSDHIKLGTDPTGTTVLMQKYVKEPPREPLFKIIPDTW